MVGTTATSGTSGSPCCESGGRGSSATMTPDSQSTVCSLPATYDSRLLSTYPRLATSGLYGSAAYADQAYPNFAGVDSSAFYPSLGSAYGMKDASDPWRGIGPSASYYYDPSLAAYGYGGLDFNGARRKNVTRDSTSTLKAWLNEHRKNPYPTKGEKIMLAIITKMTLTQVSTWFANARRRLKKENKMTWEPRNKMDADDVKEYEDDDLDDEDEKDDKKDIRSSSIDHRLGEREDTGSRRTGPDDSRTLSVIKRGSSGCEVESGDDCEAPDTRMTPGGSSNEDGVEFGSSRSGTDGYHHLRHPNIMSDSLSITLAGCEVRDRHIDRHPPDSSLLAPDFTPSDSSSPALPEIQTLMRTPDEATNKESSLPATSRTQSNSISSRNCVSNRTSSSSGSDLADSSGHQVKPKIWSLADTATSKSPAPSSTSQCGEVNSPGSVTDMLGHCGWFSVNPYQVTPPTSTLGGLVGSHGYPPSFASPSSNGAMFSGSASAAAAYGHGFSPVPPQTDTPPQTPPNLKVSTALPLSASSASYLSSQTAHLYFGQAAATVGKNGGIYPISHLNSGSRPYRPELLPEDFSSTSAQFRSPPIQ